MGTFGNAYDGQTVQLTWTRAVNFDITADATEVRKAIDEHAPGHEDETIHDALWSLWGDEETMDAILSSLAESAGESGNFEEITTMDVEDLGEEPEEDEDEEEDDEDDSDEDEDPDV